MAPQTSERPQTAQEAFLADQRAAIERGDAPVELGEVEYGPNAVHGYDTDEKGESSTHNVINSPYLKQRLAQGRKIARPDDGNVPFAGDVEPASGRRHVDRSHAATAVGAEQAAELRQEQAEATVQVEDGDTQSQAAAADVPGSQEKPRRQRAEKDGDDSK